MYRKPPAGQLSFKDFYLPFGGELDGGNRWVRLAELIPWEEFEGEYAGGFSARGMGAPAKPFRMALGAEIIKRKLDISDEEVANQIGENPYLQYFIGLDSFAKGCPFDSSMMSLFRERLGMELIGRVNEKVIENGKKSEAGKPKAKEKEEGKDELGGGEKSDNRGRLLIDATCVPQDIRYPTDLSLLNEAREKTEKVIDKLRKEGGGKLKEKPRTYRRKARKAYLALAKQRKKSAKAIRRGIRQQIGYVKRNLKSIAKQVENGAYLWVLKERELKELSVIITLVGQQEEMYKNKTRHVEKRIVSISQPHVRPIVRGKAGADVEFGSKMSISVVGGMARIERFSWENFNESTSLINEIERYKSRYGCYPESAHVDKIYQSRENRKFCKEKHIRISGPKLGRPSGDSAVNKKEKETGKLDANARQPVEGKFGNLKRKYGLNRVCAKLEATSECEIAVGVLVMNLDTQARMALAPLYFFLCCIYLKYCFGNKVV
jgi:hypothetical protein